MEVLDLFSAAAGGWSLGMHRAGFRTVAACEAVEWRRALYAENNPHVRLYDDVRTLTSDRLVRDLGRFPAVVVGSPPCQDISSANTKGKGVDGARSGLFFEAIRIVGEGRPRWVALENSANLRTRGADRVLGALEGLGYTAWPFVVRASDIGANHERARCWILACDADQVAGDPIAGVPERPGAVDARGAAGDALLRRFQAGRHLAKRQETGLRLEVPRAIGKCSSDASNADEARQPHGCVVTGLRAAEVANDGRRHERCDDVTEADEEWQSDGTIHAEMGRSARIGGNPAGPWSHWNGGLAAHLRVDDGLSARLAGTRLDFGNGKRPSAAGLVVEAFGDAVVPQITEAIGRAIWRVERALAAVA